jgi:hypothetical protein
MALYVDIIDGGIGNIHQMCRKKNVSFDPVSPKDLDLFDVAVLTEEAAPPGDVVSGTQVAELRGDGKWCRIYDVRSYTDEEKGAQERSWRDQQYDAVRIEINRIEDAHGSKRSTVAAWRTYRNDLRDYPQQPTFPNGTRPVSP